MKLPRKKYKAMFRNSETDEVVEVKFYDAEDADNGTSGYGIACKKRDETALEKGLLTWWSKVVPMRVIYGWNKKDGFYIVSEEELTE